MAADLAILATRMRALSRPGPAAPIMLTTTPTAMPTHDPDELLTPREIARLAKMHPRTVLRLAIPWIRVGRCWRLRRRDWQDFAAGGGR